MNIRTSLWTLAVVNVVVAIVIMILNQFGMLSLQQMLTKYETGANDLIEMQRAGTAFTLSCEQYNNAIVLTMLAQPDLAQKELKDAQDRVAEVVTTLTDLEKRELIGDDVLARAKKIQALMKKGGESIKGEDSYGAGEMYQKEMAKPVKTLRQNLADAVDAKKKAMSNELTERRNTHRVRSIISFVVVALVVVGTLGFVVIMISWLMSALTDMVKVTEAFGEGRYDSRVDVRRKDELGKLGTTINAMADAIQKQQGEMTDTIDQQKSMLGTVASVSDALDSGATQFQHATAQLSDGAVQQSASLQEISSSLTDFGHQAKQNASHASEADTLVRAAKDAADKGNGSMSEMIGAMSEINDSSREISKIIKVIDDIAFQTNLLALNAAVEAARAGRHGKGFAVVAEEVRNLASRSAKAASETSQLIEGSVKRVQNGSEIADETANALKEIVESVSKVTGLVTEIATASNDQAIGLNEINQGLDRVDNVTQQNAASAEETAAAAAELSKQADRLKNLLANYGAGGVTGNLDTYSQVPEFSAQSGLAFPSEPEPAPVQEPQWGWGENTSSPDRLVQPEQQIVLDDNEFGKY